MEPNENKWEKVSSFVEAIALFSKEIAQMGKQLNDYMFQNGQRSYEVKDKLVEFEKEVKDIKAIVYNLKDNIDGLREEVRQKVTKK